MSIACIATANCSPRPAASWPASTAMESSSGSPIRFANREEISAKRNSLTAISKQATAQIEAILGVTRTILGILLNHPRVDKHEANLVGPFRLRDQREQRAVGPRHVKCVTKLGKQRLLRLRVLFLGE